MGFSGGGSNILKAHTHNGLTVQDGGALDFDNITQSQSLAGMVFFSDGTHLQQLAYPGVPAGQTLTAAALSTSPSWVAAAGGGETCQTPLGSANSGLGGNGGAITRLGVHITDGANTVVGKSITELSFWLSKGGSPTGNGTVTIYNNAGVLQATSTDTLDWSTLTGSAVKHSFAFAAYTVQNGDYFMCSGGSTGIGNEVTVAGDESASSISFQCYAKYCDGSGTCGAAGFYDLNGGTSDCRYCWNT